MDIKEVEKRIESVLPDADFELDGKDCSFKLTIVSDEFIGLTVAKRQMWILNAFKQEFADGRLHALSIKAYSIDEWNRRNNHLVQLA